MLTVTKQFDFCYGHHLPDYAGLCCEQHGHNSILEVEVGNSSKSGYTAPDGMIADFSYVKAVVTMLIVKKLDQ